MKNFVEIHISSSAADVLARISAATERESLPFVSASTTLKQREKSFVSRISGNRFRIWRVPSSKGGHNLGMRYLRGVVSEAGGESNLKGSFALHPFNKVLALIPLAMVTPALFGVARARTAWEMIFIAIFIAFCLVAVFIFVEAARRGRPQEEQDVVNFVVSLFPDARPS